MVNVVVFARDCQRQGYDPLYIAADQNPTLSQIKQQPVTCTSSTSG
jgi:hypothetical protein